MNKFGVISFLILFPVLIFAQPSEGPLNLEACVQIALDNNVDVNTSRNLAEISRLTANGSYSNILPRIDANFSGGQLQFDYLQEIDKAGSEFAEPGREARLTERSEGILWLLELVRNN